MEALPIGFGVGTIDRTGNAGNGGELHAIELGQVPPLFYHCRNALQLLATDRRLDVGQAVVETDLVIALEYDAAGGMALTVGHRHAVMAQPAKARGKLDVVGRDHAAIAGGQELARMEGEAGGDAEGAADLAPAFADADPAADRAGGIFDQCQTAAPGNLCDRIDPSRHAELVD